MIKRAVFSYFNPQENFNNKCGFKYYSDFLYTIALALHLASKHFREVYFISSKWGVEIFKEMGFPVTTYSDSFEKIKDISPFFWAYGKLMAYCEQDKPFVHVDNDVFLWKPLPPRILNAELCFQSLEPFHLDGYKYYYMLKEPFNHAPVKPEKIVKNEVMDFAYNCGICGGSNLAFFKEWKECSEQYIFAPENQEVFFDQFDHLLIHQNLFHEQYFASSLIQMHGMRDKVRVLGKDIADIGKNDPVTSPPYTHLWGTAKSNALYMAKVKLSLLYRDESLFGRIQKFCIENNLHLPYYPYKT